MALTSVINDVVACAHGNTFHVIWFYVKQCNRKIKFCKYFEICFNLRLRANGVSPDLANQ